MKYTLPVAILAVIACAIDTVQGIAPVKTITKIKTVIHVPTKVLKEIVVTKTVYQTIHQQTAIHPDVLSVAREFGQEESDGDFNRGSFKKEVAYVDIGEYNTDVESEETPTSDQFGFDTDYFTSRLGVSSNLEQNRPEGKDFAEPLYYLDDNDDDDDDDDNDYYYYYYDDDDDDESVILHKADSEVIDEEQGTNVFLPYDPDYVFEHNRSEETVLKEHADLEKVDEDEDNVILSPPQFITNPTSSDDYLTKTKPSLNRQPTQDVVDKSASKLPDSKGKQVLHPADPENNQIVNNRTMPSAFFMDDLERTSGDAMSSNPHRYNSGGISSNSINTAVLISAGAVAAIGLVFL